MLDMATMAQLTVICGMATAAATEILKSPIIPIPFERAPRITAAVVSLIAAIIAMYNSGVQSVDVTDLPQLLALASFTFLVAISTYNHLTARQDTKL